MSVPDERENEGADELTEKVESALRAFHRGDSSEFEDLLDSADGAGPGVGEMFDPALPERTIRVDGLSSQSKVAGYRIIREIGRGGMGVVYEAEQREPRRRVALKVLRGPWEDEHRVKLFRREVQTLARLRHPAIATIYEAGQSEDGQHFFTMELVSGAPLCTYMRAHQVSLREELELFVKIADAVQYAHSQGVIHRDLKPSNILVDAEGNPRIVDFGLARTTDVTSTLTILTESGAGHIVGTLAYMSPEQARGESGQIDGRCDVYALGMVLYELLTGQLPFDLKKTQPQELLRVVCEEPPRKPSGIDPSLGGDLETIVLKALAKERSWRYASPRELREDVQRYLNREPVLARRPSGLYLVRKKLFKHRRRIAVALGAAALVSLAMYTTLWSRHRAIEAESRFDLARIDRRAGQGECRQALEEYTRWLDEHPARGKDLTHAFAYSNRAQMYLSLGEYQKAVDDFTHAIEFVPPDTLCWPMYYRATPLWILGEHARAAADYRDFSRLKPDHLYAQSRLFLVQRDLARQLARRGQIEEAQRTAAAADAELAAALRDAPQRWSRRILECLSGQCTPEALVAAAEPGDEKQHCEVYYYAGEVCLLTGQMDQATQWFERCVGTGWAFDRVAGTLVPMNEYHLAVWRLQQMSAERAVSTQR